MINNIACWAIILVMALLPTKGHSFQESYFIKDSICDVQERFEEGCSKEVPQNNLLSCLTECGGEASCIGASVEKSTRKCFHHEARSNPKKVCDTSDPNHDFYASYCVHGRWDSHMRSCKCVLGCFGVRCNKAHQNCDGLLQLGYIPGVNWAYIDPKQNDELYMIKCYVSKTYRNTHILFNNGGLDFNRTWNGYLNGFRPNDLSQNMWIGLNTLHVLNTQAGCNKIVVIIKFTGGSTIYRGHFNFAVGNEDEGFSFTYKYSINNTKGNIPGPYHAGECLDSIQNTPFSTWDKNNNGGDVIKNCAARVGSGWWHPRDCDNPCNFLGWGLEDWNIATSHQRLSMLGVDMAQAASLIEYCQMYLDWC